jgi:hypothetical protein
LPAVVAAAARGFFYAPAAFLVIAISAASAAEQTRVRLAFGGGEGCAWRATVSVSEGTLSEPRPLGIEADEPGSMWIEQGALWIRQRGARGYDGVDVTVNAPPTAKLALRFSPADRADDAAKTIELSLGELGDEYTVRELDARGNRLLAMRAPGDALHVRIARDNLVFAPGETLKFAVEPRGLKPPEKTKLRLRAQLLGGEKELWAQQQEIAVEADSRADFELALPDEEGVYDLALAASASFDLTQAVRQPLNWKRTLAQRRVQLIVISPRRRPNVKSDGKWTQVVEIDPANPRWYEKLGKLPQLPLTKNKLPRQWQGPLGNGCLTTFRHPLGELAQLKPSADSPDVSWEAYWLPINQPGRPHILEIDYPSDAQQTLSVCVLEPDAAGGLATPAIDAGFDNDLGWGDADRAPEWRRHRVLFWPRTSAPLVMIGNGRQGQPALYGKIRVLAGGERPPRAAPSPVPGGRILAAYMDRPLLAEAFASPRALDQWSGRALDDWRTFHEAGSRLVDYLRHAGYNALALSVAADGSALYPSDLLQPTPRYDTGEFFATAQDPLRKDVLEMLLRVFDREELQLIAAVEFAAPLPELERVLRRGGAEALGVELIGPEGDSLVAARPPRRGLAPYYNLLHPRVQQAMLRVLRELAGRYRGHQSLGGLAVRLAPNGYALLPGPEWGLDDATIARFEAETRVRVPGEGPRRYAQRAEFLARDPQRRDWLEWRAAQVAGFYRKAAAEIAVELPNARLYLLGAEMLGGEELDAELRPSLARQATLAATLLRVGLDARLLGEEPRIILPRPERIVPHDESGRRAAELELARMSDADEYFQRGAAAASLFYHLPREVRVESFERLSPFKPGRLWLAAQSSPAGPAGRRRFIHALARLDAQAIFDGGWTPALGRDADSQSLAAAFLALPAAQFQTVAAGGPSEVSQPVVFRSCSHNGRTYLYAVNEAPFPIVARVRVEAGPACRVEELTGGRKVAPLMTDSEAGQYWEVGLDAYDFVAVRLTDPAARFSRPRATWSSEIGESLAAEIRRLASRASALRDPAPLDVPPNADFELSPTADSPIPDWSTTQRSDIEIRLDAKQSHGGRQSVRLASAGPVACLASRPFRPPGTGRLAVSVWIRVADGSRQPPLRLAVEGKLLGRDYYRYAPVGLATEENQQVVPLLPSWARYVFQVDDLPLEGLAALRVRFDLMGAGEVWLDDVQVYALAFSKPELVELSKLITLADVKLQNGRVSDCLWLLEGYWPRFLAEQVPLPRGEALASRPRVPAAASAEEKPAEKPTEKPDERNSLMDRVKGMLRL